MFDYFCKYRNVDLLRCKCVFFFLTFLYVCFLDLAAWTNLDPVFLGQAVSFYKFLPLPFFSATGGLICKFLLLVSLLFSALNLFPRVSHSLAALLGFLILNYANNFGKVDHGSNMIAFGLLTFCLHSWMSPPFSKYKIWSSPEQNEATDQSFAATWPFRFMQLALALMYTEAGLQKLHISGPSWVFSENMQLILLQGGLPFGEWLANSRFFCSILAGASVLLEVTSFASIFLFNTKIWWLYPFSWAAMHLGIYYALGADFRWHLLTMVFCIPFFRIGKNSAQWVEFKEIFNGFRLALFLSNKAYCFLAILLFVGFCINFIYTREDWPFSANRMYGESYVSKPKKLYTLVFTDVNGNEFTVPFNARLKKDDGIYPFTHARIARNFRKRHEKNKDLSKLLRATLSLYRRNTSAQNLGNRQDSLRGEAVCVTLYQFVWSRELMNVALFKNSEPSRKENLGSHCISDQL